jgi:hypothetical protein
MTNRTPVRDRLGALGGGRIIIPMKPGNAGGGDDLVILCRRGKAEEALQRLREIMGKLKLTVNEEKTRIYVSNHNYLKTRFFFGWNVAVL